MTQNKAVAETRTELAVRGVHEMMDTIDQSQVMALERGEILEGLVFSFKQYNPETKKKDKEVFGLTIAGHFDVARDYFAQKQYRFTSEIRTLDYDDKHVRVVTRGTLMDKDGKIFMSLDRACRIPRFRGKFEDEFADRKAQSIAERNILRRMIPEATVIKMVKEFVQKGKVIYLTPNESFSALTPRCIAPTTYEEPKADAELPAHGPPTDQEQIAIKTEELFDSYGMTHDVGWTLLHKYIREGVTPDDITEAELDSAVRLLKTRMGKSDEEGGLLG